MSGGMEFFVFFLVCRILFLFVFRLLAMNFFSKRLHSFMNSNGMPLRFRFPLILFLSLLTALPLVAQQGPVQVNGFILAADSVRPIPYAAVMNLNTRRGAYSGYDGYYSIVMGRTDTLEFRVIGYETQYFTLPPGLSTSYFTLNVLMRPTRYELEEYVYDPFNYDRVLQSMKSLPLPEHETRVTDPDIGRSYSAPRMGAGLVFSGPITKLYNRFSRRGREMQRLEALLAGDDHVVESRRKLTPELIQQVTGLQYDDIQEFVRYCQLGHEFISQASLYDIMVAIDRCYKQFVIAYPELKTMPTDSTGQE